MNDLSINTPQYARLVSLQSGIVRNNLPEDDSEPPDSKTGLGSLTMLAGLSACLYGAISLLSWRFEFDSEVTQRPIILVLCLFAVAFCAYMGAIRIVWRAPRSRQMVKLIVATAVVFRVVMLFSLPIQEVDIYRYLWDGAVSTAGVSPFRYSPQQVSSADLATTDDADLERLVTLRDHQPAFAEILRRVHFPELPTIYPPTSQAIFAAASLSAPSDATLLTRLFLMKAWLIGFDLGTLFVLILLLRLCEKPIGLCVIYAWCPLLMKEVAGSGHLDAIAVFATTLAVYLTVRFCQTRTETDSRHSLHSNNNSLIARTMIGFVLALAVGAKLYPVVLAPLLFFSLASKCGWRRALVPAAVFTISTAVLLSTMVPSGKTISDQELGNDPSLGVVTFLRRWEMNDFIFLLIIENLKPNTGRGPHEVAWFTVMPETSRVALVDSVASRFGVAPIEVPFFVSRVVTAVLFIVVALSITWRTASKEISQIVEGAFLTLAWFWLLCPTQNPWYWTWALPLLPFARSRVWLAVSGLVLIYYLRFWLSYHYAETAVLGTPYTGIAFYDFVITWIEFAPWFVLLIVSFLRCPKSFECGHLAEGTRSRCQPWHTGG